MKEIIEMYEQKIIENYQLKKDIEKLELESAEFEKNYVALHNKNIRHKIHIEQTEIRLKSFVDELYNMTLADHSQASEILYEIGKKIDNLNHGRFQILNEHLKKTHRFVCDNSLYKCKKSILPEIKRKDD